MYVRPLGEDSTSDSLFAGASWRLPALHRIRRRQSSRGCTFRTTCADVGPLGRRRRLQGRRRTWRAESCKRRRPGSAHRCLSPMSSGETTLLSEGT